MLEEFPELELKEEMPLWDILAKIFQKTKKAYYKRGKTPRFRVLNVRR